MKKLLFWGLPFALLVALVGWRFRALSAANPAGQSGGGKKGSPTIEVARATKREIVESVQAVASIESPLKVEISPKSAGRIEYLEAREGDKVEVGQVLLKIDPSDLEGSVLQQEAALAEARFRYTQAKTVQNSTNVGVTSQVQQQQAGLKSSKASFDQVQQNYASQVATAEAQISQAESALSNARSSLDKETSTLLNLQTKYDRTMYLYKQNFIAAQDVDDARTAIDVQKSSVEVAKGLVSAAESQLKVQQQNLLMTKRKGFADIAAGQANLLQGEATLRVAQANRSQSPAYQQNLQALLSQVAAAEAQLRQAQARLSDTVIRSTISGTVTARKADPGGLASPGIPVLEVQFLDWIYVTATLPIDSGVTIKPGQVAELTIDGLAGETFSGPITNINPAADPLSRQFGVKVRLDNARHLIRPGMYGRIRLIIGKVDAMVVVPKEAIIAKSDGTTSVVVVDESKVAHIRPVKLGVSDDRGAQVLDGVQAGDQVVVLTFNPLKEGQKVSISAEADGKGKGKHGSKDDVKSPS